MGFSPDYGFSLVGSGFSDFGGKTCQLTHQLRVLEAETHHQWS